MLEPYVGQSEYDNCGQRVVIGQRLMQAASDLFLGWTRGEAGRDFYVRQLRDVKIKPVVEVYDSNMMDAYARVRAAGCWHGLMLVPAIQSRLAVTWVQTSGSTTRLPILPSRTPIKMTKITAHSLGLFATVACRPKWSGSTSITLLLGIIINRQLPDAVLWVIDAGLGERPEAGMAQITRSKAR